MWKNLGNKRLPFKRNYLDFPLPLLKNLPWSCPLLSRQILLRNLKIIYWRSQRVASSCLATPYFFFIKMKLLMVGLLFSKKFIHKLKHCSHHQSYFNSKSSSSNQLTSKVSYSVPFSWWHSFPVILNSLDRPNL